MKIWNLRCGLVMAAVALTCGCGKQERIEAVQFAKAIAQNEAAFASANATEKDLVNNARAWCGSIVANGAGRGAELDQNAAVAAALAKSAITVSSQLGQVRQSMDQQPLKEEYPKSVRAELISQLTKRQRLLQDIRALFEQAAPQFLEYRQSRAYAGDTYPDGVAKLDALFGAYKPPDDALATAAAALKGKYHLTSNEL